jgi:hypothetical protein
MSTDGLLHQTAWGASGYRHLLMGSSGLTARCPPIHAKIGCALSCEKNLKILLALFRDYRQVAQHSELLAKFSMVVDFCLKPVM